MVGVFWEGGCISCLMESRDLFSILVRGFLLKMNHSEGTWNKKLSTKIDPFLYAMILESVYIEKPGFNFFQVIWDL
jgi:hypothetical protein